MKKYLGILALILATTSFAGTLKIGATPVPAAELLNEVKADLKKDGVDLVIVEFTDYVTPNLALDSGDIDGNFFQHKPYLEMFSKEKGLKLAPVGAILVAPIGVYSKRIDSIDKLKDGAVVAIPNDATNGGRALILLHNRGLIKLQDPNNLLATEVDIISNPKKLKFKSLEAAQIPRVLQDVDLAVINGNYALEAGLDSKSALLQEGKESPYANEVVVKQGNENNEDIKKLVKALQSEKIKKFIEQKYKGTIIPAF